MMPNDSLNDTGVIPVWIVYERSLTVWTILMLAFGVISATLNVMLILSIIFNRQLARIGGSEILLINFLFIELCISGGIVPALAITTAFARFRSTTESCRIFYFVIGMFAQVDFWAAFFLALNRLTAIVFPHRHGSFSSKKAILAMILFNWLLPFSDCFPQAAGVAGRNGVVPPWLWCGVLPPTTDIGRFLQVLILAVGSYLPLCGTVATYLVIFAILQVWKVKERRHTGEAVNPQGTEKTQKRLRMAKMLFGSSVWFLSCYLPYTMTLVYFPSLFVTVRVMQLWMRLLYYSGIMGSPIIFLLLSRDYRKRLAQLLHKIWKPFGRKTLCRSKTAPLGTSTTAGPQRSALGTGSIG